METAKADVVVVGAGLAGLVATAELADAGHRVVVVEQEGEQSLGGQAFWSLGGLFMVGTPEQRRMGVRDSYELALRDWHGSAQFDRPEDHWPRRWAEAYVDFAAHEKRAWLRAQGLKLFPIVGWAERGDGRAGGHGNSVPRFHIAWGTGPGVLEPFLRRVQDARERGLVSFAFRHRVDELIMADGTCVGVRGAVLAPDDAERGAETNREVVGDFEALGQAVIVASGGIGGNLDLVRQAWPERLGQPPTSLVQGVPAHVDGRMIGITQAAGGQVINPDRMWHYTEGLRNFAPIWPNHGIRIIPGPSSMWFDATGRRLPAPNFPGFDSLGTLQHILASGQDYSWFVLTRAIIEKEFALSGSEQNPDLTGRDIKLTLGRIRPGAPGPVQAFLDRGEDFVQADNLADLVARMNNLAGNDLLSVEALEAQIVDRDMQIDHDFGKDAQISAIRNALRYRGDKLGRTTPLHKILDPDSGPLIAVRLNILTRKTLGGLHTDLDARVLRADGSAVTGLYAVGEASGFGGGGVHGYNALEGTFLGGCLFSGRQAGRAAAAAL